MVDGRRQRGAETRERVIEDPRRVIDHQGVERTSFADVAQEAVVRVAAPSAEPATPP